MLIKEQKKKIQITHLSSLNMQLHLITISVPELCSVVFICAIANLF